MVQDSDREALMEVHFTGFPLNNMLHFLCIPGPNTDFEKENFK